MNSVTRVFGLALTMKVSETLSKMLSKSLSLTGTYGSLPF